MDAFLEVVVLVELVDVGSGDLFDEGDKSSPSWRFTCNKYLQFVISICNL